jgi:hypothetical protein
MKHLKKFNESIVSDLTFHRYYDKMSKDDELKLDNILEKDPSDWSSDDKEFMDKMSMKNRKLFIGSNNKVYTENDIINMGLDPNKICNKEENKIKNTQLINQISSLISDYRGSINKSKKFIDSNQYEIDIIPIVNKSIKILEDSVEKLKNIR